MKKAKRYAFVVPRFGETIFGGAETLVALIAQQLMKRGDDVEILTTCAYDHRTWANEFPPGPAVAYGLPVTRFPVDPRNLDVWVPLQIGLSEGQRLDVETQLTWMQESVNSWSLYQHLVRYEKQWDAVFFGPYLFGTTFFGALSIPRTAVLIPCLHDEAYAYLDIMGSLFRQVRGAIFNAEPERDLAQALYGKIAGGSVGLGFEPIVVRDDIPLPTGMPTRPYLLYCGRKETGKNVQLIIDYFIQSKAQGKLSAEACLVITGGGSFDDLHRPEAKLRDDIIDLPPVDELQKHRLMRDALAFVTLSTNESFSIVLMESWLCRTPVIVHGGCLVTRNFVLQSGGGVYVSSAEEFAEAVGMLRDDAQLRARLADAGENFVRSYFSWKSVLERFDRAVENIFGEQQDGARGS